MKLELDNLAYWHTRINSLKLDFDVSTKDKAEEQNVVHFFVCLKKIPRAITAFSLVFVLLFDVFVKLGNL